MYTLIHFLSSKDVLVEYKVEYMYKLNFKVKNVKVDTRLIHDWRDEKVEIEVFLCSGWTIGERGLYADTLYLVKNLYNVSTTKKGKKVEVYA